MFEFRIVPKVIFGAGSVERIKDEIKGLGAEKILVVTDRGLVKAGLVKKVLELLKDFETVVFEDVEPNPKDTNVEEGLRIFKGKKCDLMLGVGGGSPMDTAKAIAAMATNPGSLWDYSGVDKFKSSPIPLILVPTTAGTGSEVSRAAMITNTSTKQKTLFLSWHLTAKVAILDPNLTISLPPQITTWSGMDALSHAVESYISNLSTPISDLFAGRAIELIYRNIKEVVKNGKNVEARSNMLLGSLLAGVAVANARLGNVHTLAHSVGGQYDLPHGFICGILLPIVMEYNLNYSTEKFKKIAEILGERTQGLSPREAAQRGIKLIVELRDRLGLPKGLGEVGVKKNDIPQLVERSFIIPSNPRPTTKEDLFSLYERAI